MQPIANYIHDNRHHQKTTSTVSAVTFHRMSEVSKSELKVTHSDDRSCMANWHVFDAEALKDELLRGVYAEPMSTATAQAAPRSTCPATVVHPAPSQAVEQRLSLSELTDLSIYHDCFIVYVHCEHSTTRNERESAASNIRS